MACGINLDTTGNTRRRRVKTAFIPQSGLNVLPEMVDTVCQAPTNCGVDFVDDVDAEKDHLHRCVHFVHNVHLVHYLDKPNCLQLPNPGSW